AGADAVAVAELTAQMQTLAQAVERLDARMAAIAAATGAETASPVDAPAWAAALTHRFDGLEAAVAAGRESVLAALPNDRMLGDDAPPAWVDAVSKALGDLADQTAPVASLAAAGSAQSDDLKRLGAAVWAVQETLAERDGAVAAALAKIDARLAAIEARSPIGGPSAMAPLAAADEAVALAESGALPTREMVRLLAAAMTPLADEVRRLTRAHTTGGGAGEAH
ncbi:MAG: hypothetical protein AAF684_10715, partial [Pseudomonadota bacterium]